jgi:sigma-E factor negative regulatory protein RseA
MPAPNPPTSRSREILSALADGQVQPGEFDIACAAWRDDAEGRACWHAYHLIGDVMRSDELAAWSGHDEEFLQSLRSRLAKEPVPLAPSPRPAAPSFWRRLTAPAAVAAGFAVVAGAVVVLRSPFVPEAPPPTTLAANSGPQTLPPAEAFALVRDNHFDSYFEAHRQQSIRRAALVDGPVAPPRIEAMVVESR